MLTFNLTIHHLWGRVLAKFQSQTIAEARTIAYADDGYSMVTLRPSWAWDFRSWLRSNMSSSKMLDWSSTFPKPPSYPRVSLSRLTLMWSRTSYKLPPRFLTWGCSPLLFESWRLRWYRCVYWYWCFCTELGIYMNSHILLGNRCVLQQQHVDCKIAEERQDLWLSKDDLQDSSSW